MLIALMLVCNLFSLLIRGWAGGLGARANFLIDAILVFTSLAWGFLEAKIGPKPAETGVGLPGQPSHWTEAKKFRS